MGPQRPLGVGWPGSCWRFLLNHQNKNKRFFLDALFTGWKEGCSLRLGAPCLGPCDAPVALDQQGVSIRGAPTGGAPTDASREGGPQGPPSSSSSVGRLLVALGTYDGGLLGYRVEMTENLQGPKTQEANLQRVFAVRAHAGCVKALCTPGRLLVSGGTDETLRAYDLDALEEQGSARALEQRGIEALAAGGPSACVSLSEEGALRVWRVSDWQLLKKVNVKGVETSRGKEMKPKSRVIQSRGAQQLSVHPSARLALCLSGSDALQLVDLVKGRCTAAFALDEGGRLAVDVGCTYTAAPLDVCWSPDGSLFATLSTRTAKIMGIDGDCRATLRSNKEAPWSSMAFGSRGFFFLGTSAGHVECFLLPTSADTKKAKGAPREGPPGAPQEAVCVASEKQHDSRVKALAVVELSVAGKTQQILASCDSSGLLVLWKLEEKNAKIQKTELRVLRTTDTRCRLTCLAVSLHCGAKRDKLHPPPSPPAATTATAAATAAAATATAATAATAAAAGAAADVSTRPLGKRKEERAETPASASLSRREDGERFKRHLNDERKTKKKRRVA
ncbi:hypothetical protein Emed_001039 [Eimeria media]